MKADSLLLEFFSQNVEITFGPSPKSRTNLNGGHSGETDFDSRPQKVL